MDWRFAIVIAALTVMGTPVAAGQANDTGCKALPPWPLVLFSRHLLPPGTPCASSQQRSLVPPQPYPAPLTANPQGAGQPRIGVTGVPSQGWGY